MKKKIKCPSCKGTETRKFHEVEQGAARWTCDECNTEWDML